MITIAHSPNPQHFSTATLTGGRVTAIVDKPTEPTTNLVCAGLMLFESTALFESVGRVRQNRRGEREAMDAVRAFLRAGELRFDRVTGQWFDVAFSPESLTEAEQFALHWGFNHPSNARQGPWHGPDKSIQPDPDSARHDPTVPAHMLVLPLFVRS